jgi:hypothetical protein
VKLERRAMQLLLCLAERPGQILSVEELLDRVWAGVVVHEILQIPMDLAGSVVDHDLGHLGQSLADPRDHGGLRGGGNPA